jgi:hypothetical protein
MGKFLLGTLRVFGWMAALVVVAMLVVAGMRVFALDDVDRAVLARMDVAPPPLRGTNGFAALMLVDRDVPEGDRETVLAADVDAFARWSADQVEGTSLWALAGPDDVMPVYEPFASLPAAAPMPSTDELCALSAGCLDRVRADPDGTRALLEKHAPRIGAIEDALAADFIASPYAPALAAPMPAYQHIRLPLAAAAIDAVGGDVDGAYARTCRLLAGARRADRTARQLIDKLVAQSLGRAAATLLLDLRRAYPVAALPGECAAARAPVDGDEAAICNALRGEFQWLRAQSAQMDRQMTGAAERWVSRALLVDDDLQALPVARALAPLCADDAVELALAGRLPEIRYQGDLDTIECWSAYVSCVLGRIAAPSYSPYASRALDHAAVLRLLLAAQRVADGDASPARAAIEAGVEGYPVTFDPARQRASITLHTDRPGESNQFFVDFVGLAPSPVRSTADAVAALAP